MKIRWLRKALNNIEQENTYISRENPAAANLIALRIYNSVVLLADNPTLGGPGRIPGTRELIVPDTRYIIPYRVLPRLNQVEILRVFHTSRKPPKNFSDYVHRRRVRPVVLDHLADSMDENQALGNLIAK